VQRFLFVLQGKVSISRGDKLGELVTDGYAFLSANDAHQVTALERSRIIVIEKPYLELQGEKPPASFLARVGEVARGPMKGDERVQLQKLLPEKTAFDCEVNIMDFAPGASLPYVETHFMEHGLLLLNGGGIYRLDTSWYSVEAGDIIWMGPYAAQWFGAIGRGNARYLIYKNWNRDALASS
jgi:(S)-ureidoglycine aminohydrolase